jgi:murein DD-endopeptidase MepM/ murein hydrolase activator NlpD
MLRRTRNAWIAPALLAGAACGGGGSGGDAPGDPPGPPPPAAAACIAREFTPPLQSPYSLPYEIGSTFTMFQGNCPPNPAWGHHGKYAYDFEMPIGTPVHAMRDGIVIFTEDRYEDSDHMSGHENGVWVEHADGSVADYLHMTQSSVVVVVGTAVQAGDLLGFSGNSGASDRPHLHVEAFASRGNYVKTNTVPITFSNADGATEPSGELIQGNAYTALPVTSSDGAARR